MQIITVGIFTAFFSRKPTVDETSQAIKDLFNDISHEYFDKLEEAEFTQTQQSQSSSKENYANLLKRTIVNHLKEDYSSTNSGQTQALYSSNDDAEILAEHFQARRGTLRFGDFIKMLCALFIPSKKDSTLIDDNYKTNPYISKEIPERIARAIQDIAIETPQRISEKNVRVSEDIEKFLKKILEDIETFRKNYIEKVYKLDTIPKYAPLRDRATAERELVRQVDLNREEGGARLPIKNESSLYVREEPDLDELATLIVTSNGSLLVTGYNGIGKSRFVDEVRLRGLSKIQERQPVHDFWQVVPIRVDLAGASDFLTVLSECIDKMHYLLLEEVNELTKLLQTDEKKYLAQAYEHARRNLQEHHSTSSNAGVQVDLSGKVLPNSPVGANLVMSTGKKKTVERTTDLPSYNEDKAKEYIITLINLLARSQPTVKRKVKIKLAFIFDEIKSFDNIESANEYPKDQISLLKKIKYLSERSQPEKSGKAVFLFIASYDQWPQEQELISVFKYIVPPFTAKETGRLLKDLISLPPEQKLTPKEEEIIQNYAGYLTYETEGAPKKIIDDKLKEKQESDYYTVQNCLILNSEDRPVYRLYASIQKALEDSMSSLKKSLEEKRRAYIENVKWEERIDHIQGGLYALAKELLKQLSQVSPELSVELVKLGPDGNIHGISRSSFLEDIFAKHFKEFLKPRDFIDLVEILANGLQEIDIDGNKPFLLDQQKLTISEAFTALIGDGGEIRSATERLRAIEQIERILGQEGKTTPQLVIRYIAKYRDQFGQSPRSDAIDTYLCRIFLTRNNGFRGEAADYLSSSAFYKNLKENYPLREEFLERETDELPLLDFIQLVYNGANNDSENRELAIVSLLTLLKRPLPLSIRLGSLSRLSEICDGKDLEKVVESLDPRQDINEELLKPLIALSKKSEKNLIELLFKHKFTAISAYTLKKLLSEQDDKQMEDLWSQISNEREDKFAQQIMIAILQQLPRVGDLEHKELELSGVSKINRTELPKVEDLVHNQETYSGKGVQEEKPLGYDRVGGDVSSNSSIISPFSALEYKKLRDTVLEWLDSSDKWDTTIDQSILNMAVNGNSLLCSTLEKLTYGHETAREHLAQASKTPVKYKQQQPHSPKRQWKVKQSLVTLTKVILSIITLSSAVIYFVVPFDLPADTTLFSQLMTRFLEAIYVNGSVLGIICLIEVYRLNSYQYIVRVRKVRNKYSIVGIVLLAIALVCFFVQFFLFPLVFSFSGQLALIGLLVPICLVLSKAMITMITELK